MGCDVVAAFALVWLFWYLVFGLHCAPPSARTSNGGPHGLQSEISPANLVTAIPASHGAHEQTILVNVVTSITARWH